MSLTEKIEYPSSDLQKFLNGELLLYKYPAYVDSTFNFISGFLFRLMNEVDLGYLSEVTLVVIKEMMSNSSRANAKRHYYKSRNLDIHHPRIYRDNIVKCKEEVLLNWDEYVKENKAQSTSYYIHLSIQKKEDHIEFVVENNVALLPQEKERIDLRIKAFHKYKDMNSAFAEIHDETEGAGLGIVLSLVMLMNAGISENSLNIESTDTRTITTLRIPLKLVTKRMKNIFTEKILAEIKELPSFPDNISQTIELCSLPTASVQQIADKIQQDPSLVAQIFKIVNSAGYMNRFKNPTIADAVKILGLKVIHNLLIVAGARGVINSRYRFKELNQIWESSNRTAYFAKHLSQTHPKIAEHAPVAALLYELGKIVLIAIKPDVFKQHESLLLSGRIRNSSILEEVSIGISYPEVGALLAEKWNFPQAFIVAIRYHQRPLQSPEAYSELVNTVYLASRIEDSYRKLADYWSTEPQILNEFSIHSKHEFTSLAEKLFKGYQSS